MGQLLRLTLLLLFVALGFRIPFLTEPSARRRAINTLLAYFLGAHVLVVASQVDCWPFSTHAMMANDTTLQPDQQEMIVVKAVDGLGREWAVDLAAWSPLYTQSIRGWFERVYPVVGEEGRKEALRHLFGKAEAARRERARSLRVGNERVLGPLAAPDTYAYATPGSTSDQPFTALRVYRVSWDRRDLLSDTGRRARWNLLDEHREP